MASVSTASAVAVLWVLCVVVVVSNFFWEGHVMRKLRHAMVDEEDDLFITSYGASSAAASSSSSFQSFLHSHQSQCSAKYIVEKAYQRIYQRFVESCPLGKPYGECIWNASQDDSYPWWMQRIFSTEKNSMWFREKEDGQLYHQLGYDNPELLFVHQLWFDEPRLRFCKIEKVASTQWRHISMAYYGGSLYKENHDMFGWTDDTEDAPHAVFLRDPLERFLSAYIDKCGTRNASTYKCQPFDELPGTRKSFASEKQAFDSFVQVLGLVWNFHFPPQALQCNGLFRTLPKYDFVGSMQDDRFVQDLFRLMDRYPGTKLMDIVAKEFNVHDLKKSTNFRDLIRNSQNPADKRPTDATKKVLQYFDARSVRQLLEYYAIDYVTLNLTIPDWIQGVLDQDCFGKDSLVEHASSCR